jgi:hypothetical protein
MKFIHLLPVLAAAGVLGALRPAIDSALPLGSAAAPSAEQAAGLRPAAEPPWLTQAWAESPEGISDDARTSVCGRAVLADDGSDPHAELCASAEGGLAPHVHEGGADDPHAGLHVNTEPYAAVYAGGDPHAGLHAGDVDPHAGLHDGLYDGHGADPHAAERIDGAASIDPPTAPVAASTAANGKRVASVYAERHALDQKAIRVRGVVVKLMEGILGKTYLHLQDGSGSAEAGDHDLTVTTTESFTLGETVEVEGQLAVDQDIGAGYSYPALLTGATRVAR